MLCYDHMIEFDLALELRRLHPADLPGVQLLKRVRKRHLRKHAGPDADVHTRQRQSAQKV